MSSPPAEICIHPLSPTLLPTHRYLYYVSLILTLLYPTPPPLVKGAFAYTLTYSSTLALYAFLLSSPSSTASSQQITNLDILALWSVLAPAAISTLPLLLWNRNLRSQSGASSRLIVRLWGVVVIAATISTFILLLRAPSHISPTCSDPSIITPKFRLRDPKHAEEFPYDVVFGKWYELVTKRLSPLVFIPAAFGAVTCLIEIAPPQLKSRVSQDLFLGSETGEITNIGSYSLPSMLKVLFLKLRMLVAGLTPVFFVAVVVVNEMLLSEKTDGRRIPEAEGLGEVGQWGILVGVGFVGLAAAVDGVVGKKSPRQMYEEQEFGGVGGEVIDGWKVGSEVL